MRTLLLLSAAFTATVWGQATAEIAPNTRSEIRQAVERALPPIQQSAATFVAERACFSCHHNALPILTLHMAQARGFAIDQDVLAQVERVTFRPLGDADPVAAVERITLAADVSDPTPNESLLLMSAHAANLPRTLVLELLATRLAGWQREGHWVTSDFRPPHSYSLFMSTATAVGAIRAYMPDELAAQRDAAVDAARQWLSETQPVSTEDASFRLMGLVWAGVRSADLADARADLLDMQLPSGGWPQTSRYAADAYSTGEALFALHEAGLNAADPSWQRGARFLIENQQPDGTWHVPTRMNSPAKVSPPYFETGFPYGHDQVLSYAGSTWAVLGLLGALEPNRGIAGSVPSSENVTQPVQPWIRTALFGTPADLDAILDSGLDPNSTLGDGTTLLMLAAHDPNKLQLLLDAGADPMTRTASGTDALTVAASHLGAHDALEILLNNGAEPDLPEQERAQNTALGLAAMTGDLDSVRLLLARRADANRSARNSGTPLVSAITFGHAQVAKALIDAGASVGLVDSTGQTLLHWATITNRPELIALLAQAGVPLDDFDDNGYTPVMYAASIDYGDSQTLQALLEAGADPDVPTDDDLTALEQAQKLGLEHHVEALRRFAEE